MRRTVLLIAAAFLAIFVGEASAGYDCGYLEGKWQGTCVFKAYKGECVDDIITVPYYIEYKSDSHSDKCNVWYKKDKTTIETYTKWDGSNTYSLPWYSDSGYCKLTTSGDGYCADCWYDQYDKRTYRAQYKKYGDLDVIVEEGYMKNGDSGTWSQHPFGKFGKCPTSSWKSLYCDSYEYTYRCYLVKTSGWKWKW